MEHLFSPGGLQRLAAHTRPGVACVFDFDGTLAPIVTRPADARLDDGMRHRLQALAARTPVGILSGRSLADLGARLGFMPDYLIGNHGIEGLPGWETEAQSHAAAVRSWDATLRSLLQETGEAGVALENKGYSLSLHYRQAADPGRALAGLVAAVSRLHPAPRVVDGKFVLNLLPAGAGGKGRAMERLMAMTGHAGALYVGDDSTDEEVFCLARPDLLCVRIEPDPGSLAAYHLAGQQEMPRLLDTLLDLLVKQP